MRCKYFGRSKIEVWDDVRQKLVTKYDTNPCMGPQAMIDYSVKEENFASQMYDKLVDAGYKYVGCFDDNDGREQMYFAMSDREEYEEFKADYKEFKKEVSNK